MFCPNCGNNIADGSKFCNNCGNNLQPAPAGQNFVQQPAQQSQFVQQPAPQTQYTQQAYGQADYEQPAYNQSYGGVATKPKPDTKLIAVVAIVIIAVIAGAWFLMGGGGSDPHESPKAVINEYINAFKTKNADALCNISADLKRNDNDPEMRERYIEELKEEFEQIEAPSIKIKSVEYAGDDKAYVICDVTVTLNGETHTNEDARFPCVKIDGKWYWED